MQFIKKYTLTVKHLFLFFLTTYKTIIKHLSRFIFYTYNAIIIKCYICIRQRENVWIHNYFEYYMD